MKSAAALDAKMFDLKGLLRGDAVTVEGDVGEGVHGQIIIG
jgi:hypothetical protein